MHGEPIPTEGGDARATQRTRDAGRHGPHDRARLDERVGHAS